MINLNTSFSESEIITIKLCQDKNIKILNYIKGKGYMLNKYGNLTYETCFGNTNDDYFKEQMYKEANPNRIIKYYQFYLMENKDNLGIWFVGRIQKNQTIEFLSCCEKLNEALESL